MPLVKPAPRHAAPRRHRAVLLPSALLLASGAAFAGLAALPAVAAPGTPRPSDTPAVGQPEPALVNVALYAALSKGLSAANTPGAGALAAKATASRAAKVKATASRAAKAKADAKAKAGRPAAAKASRGRTTAAAGAAGGAAGGAAFVRPGAGRVTSGYGRRWGRLHAGVDLAAGMGSPIRAVAAGTVQSAGTESGYGQAVRVVLADGTVTIYGHNSALLVQAGQRVQAGQQIAREGNSGRSTGPHLHFEVRVGDSPVNPVPWLSARGIDL